METAYTFDGGSPASVYSHKQYVLDQFCTGLVRNVPTPGRFYFAIENAHLFAEQARQRPGRMRVLIERRGSDKPWDVLVNQIDGSIMVLADDLPEPPQEGACVQLLLGYKTIYCDGRKAEQLEKEEETRWI